MKHSHYFCIIALFFSFTLHSQSVEVEGQLKVTQMDTAENEQLLVVKKADGTLATRTLKSLPPDPPDTTRNLETDFALAKLLCDCNNNLPPFLIQSALESGYTYQNLLGAGITPLSLWKAGVPADSLYGETYEGGLIFYIDTLGVHAFEGLVCAPSDQSSSAEWGCFANIISGADGTAIGTGAQNTIDIENGCGVSGIAADICASLSLNFQTDWFLPSKDELNEMYLNLYLNGLGNFVISNNYWSSSENNFADAWSHWFGGSQGMDTKSNLRIVRAVREF